MLDIIFTTIYIISVLAVSIYGLQALLMSLLFVLKWNHKPATPSKPVEWPTVTVQLPIYNEKYVVERLIDSVCRLEYPPDKLSIQVLDDSTDDTTCLVASRVRAYRKNGIDITLHHRKNRSGFKAGALSAGLAQAKGELIAVFDADFVPPGDFLYRLVPYLAADPQLGMAQARWSHLNADYNLLTRSQALLLDGYFVVEQTARSRSGLLFNFNGSGGIWRKECIIDSGGWQDDTLAEDLDLSYRAQLKGWRITYVPDVVIPGELPAQIGAFRHQQYRWTRGGIQVLRKLFTRLSTARQLSMIQRMMAFIHLSGNLSYALILIALLSSLPVVLYRGQGMPYMPWLSLAGLGGPILFGLSQASTYIDWRRRLIHLPVLLLLRIGLTFSNTRAVIAGFRHQSGVFERTPKYHLESSQDSWQHNKYRLRLDVDIIAELLLGIYSAVTLSLALRLFPPISPTLAMFTLGFLLTGLTSLIQSLVKNDRQSSFIGTSGGEYRSQSQLQPDAPPIKTPIF